MSVERLLLNEKLMKRTECYTEGFRQGCLTKNFSHLFSSSTSCSQMVGQGKLAGQSKSFGRDYLCVIIGGTTLNMNNYEKLNRALPKCVTARVY